MATIASIIIPVYNAELYLARCIDSVLQQTMQDFELICVDDGSTDKSLEILNRYQQIDTRLHIMHQKRCYAGSARNAAIQKARGKYLYFMDADDFCEPMLLEAAIAKAESCNADIVVFDYQTFEIENGPYEYRSGCMLRWLPKKKEIFEWRDVPKCICEIAFLAPWCKLYRADLVKQHLMFDTTQTSNDTTFSALSMISAKTIVYLPQMLYHYRVSHAGTITSAKHQNLNDIFVTVNSFVRQAETYPQFEYILPSVRMFCINRVLWILQNCMEDADSSARIQFYERCRDYFTHDPLFDQMDEDSILSIEVYQKYQIVLCCDTYSNMKCICNMLAQTQSRALSSSVSYRIGSTFTWLPRKVGNSLPQKTRNFLKRKLIRYIRT